MIDACRGIAAAHASGLIHREIKPASFLRAADGFVKIADFGLARGMAAQTQQMTQAGTVIGTPFFMSPEQCQPSSVDARSDIYSLGATYYSLLTGRNPYHDSTSVPQVMYAHCHAEVPETNPSPVTSVAGRSGIRRFTFAGGAVVFLLIALSLMAWRPWERATINSDIPAAPAGEPIKTLLEDSSDRPDSAQRPSDSGLDEGQSGSARPFPGQPHVHAMAGAVG